MTEAHKPGSGKKLTAQQAIFAAEYAKTGKGKDSAIKAGYAEKGADSQAAQLLRNHKVQEELQRLCKKAEERNGLTIAQADAILEELVQAKLTDYQQILPDGDSALVVDKDSPHPHAIKKLKVKLAVEGTGDGTHDVRYVEVELHDKLRALELFYKRKGALVEKVAQTDGQGRDVQPWIYCVPTPKDMAEWEKWHAEYEKAREKGKQT